MKFYSWLLNIITRKMLLRESNVFNRDLLWTNSLNFLYISAETKEIVRFYHSLSHCGKASCKPKPQITCVFSVIFIFDESSKILQTEIVTCNEVEIIRKMYNFPFPKKDYNIMVILPKFNIHRQWGDFLIVAWVFIALWCVSLRNLCRIINSLNSSRICFLPCVV